MGQLHTLHSSRCFTSSWFCLRISITPPPQITHFEAEQQVANTSMTFPLAMSCLLYGCWHGLKSSHYNMLNSGKKWRVAGLELRSKSLNHPTEMQHAMRSRSHWHHCEVTQNKTHSHLRKCLGFHKRMCPLWTLMYDVSSSCYSDSTTEAAAWKESLTMWNNCEAIGQPTSVCFYFCTECIRFLKRDNRHVFKRWMVNPFPSVLVSTCSWNK